jgi:hypothetical protein
MQAALTHAPFFLLTSFEQYGEFYLPCGVAMVYVSILYFRVYQTIKNYVQLGGANKRLLRLVRVLKWFPLVFVLAWVPQAAIRIILSLTGNFSDKVDRNLALVDAACRGTFFQAVGHTLVYGWNKAVKDQWKKVLFGGRAGCHQACCSSDNRDHAESDATELGGSKGGGGGGGIRDTHDLSLASIGDFTVNPHSVDFDFGEDDLKFPEFRSSALEGNNHEFQRSKIELQSTAGNSA